MVQRSSPSIGLPTVPRLAGPVARLASRIRIDAAWLAIAPMDMRAGTETALARVVIVFGAAHPHHAYIFANKRQPIEGARARRHRRMALCA